MPLDVEWLEWASPDATLPDGVPPEVPSFPRSGVGTALRDDPVSFPHCLNGEIGQLATGYPFSTQPIRSLSEVMCATWWRPCQAYRPTIQSRVRRPCSGWRQVFEKSCGFSDSSSMTQRL